MNLYVDLETLRLIEAPGFRNPIQSIRIKRGDGAQLQTLFLLEGKTATQIGDPETLDLKFGVKSADELSGPYLVYAGEWTFPVVDPETTDNAYLVSPSFNTEALNAALGIGTENELTEIKLVGEISWTVGAGAPTSTRTFTVIVENDVIRGTEGTPLENPDPEAWLNARRPAIITGDLPPLSYLAPQRQAEYAQVTLPGAGLTTSAGTQHIVVTGAGIAGSPVTVDVAITTGMNRAAVLAAQIAALNGNAAVAALYTADVYSTANLRITRNTAAPNDSTLNIAWAAGFNINGVVTSSTSTAGVFVVPTTGNVNDLYRAGSSWQNYTWYRLATLAPGPTWTPIPNAGAESYTAFVRTGGNNATALVGRPDLPFSTAQAAYDAVRATPSGLANTLFDLGVGTFYLTIPLADTGRTLHFAGKGDMTTIGIIGESVNGQPGTRSSLYCFATDETVYGPCAITGFGGYPASTVGSPGTGATIEIPLNSADYEVAAMLVSVFSGGVNGAQIDAYDTGARGGSIGTFPFATFTEGTWATAGSTGVNATMFAQNLKITVSLNGGAGDDMAGDGGSLSIYGHGYVNLLSFEAYGGFCTADGFARPPGDLAAYRCKVGTVYARSFTAALCDLTETSGMLNYGGGFSDSGNNTQPLPTFS